MNALLATALAAGELICEFSDGYRKSFLAQIAHDAPRPEMFLVYEEVTPDSARVVASRRAGAKPVRVRADGEYIHLIQEDGPSLRMTTLTACLRHKERDGADVCTRFAARHAWYFDTGGNGDPDASFRRQPSGGASGTCEPWRVD